MFQVLFNTRPTHLKSVDTEQLISNDELLSNMLLSYNDWHVTVLKLVIAQLRAGECEYNNRKCLKISSRKCQKSHANMTYGMGDVCVI
jgi:hypothetical protein